MLYEVITSLNRKAFQVRFSWHFTAPVPPRSTLTGHGSQTCQAFLPVRAIHLFEESALSDPKLGHLARLHQGQILLRLGDRERARQIWRDYLATLPAGDERRSAIEAELAHIPSS